MNFLYVLNLSVKLELEESHHDGVEVVLVYLDKLRVFSDLDGGCSSTFNVSFLLNLELRFVSIFIEQLLVYFPLLMD